MQFGGVDFPRDFSLVSVRLLDDLHEGKAVVSNPCKRGVFVVNNWLWRVLSMRTVDSVSCSVLSLIRYYVLTRLFALLWV